MPSGKLTRLTMEFSDGTTQSLIGADANVWYEVVNGYIAVGQLRGGGVDPRLTVLKWTRTKKPARGDHE